MTSKGYQKYLFVGVLSKHLSIPFACYGYKWLPILWRPGYDEMNKILVYVSAVNADVQGTAKWIELNQTGHRKRIIS